MSLKYLALLTQSGEDAPSATVFDELSSPVVWSRNGPGEYSATNSAFVPGKTWPMFSPSLYNNLVVTIVLGQITIQTIGLENTEHDSLILNMAVEIRVYSP